ncbi:het-domain-containing protein [Fusarium bulbicola]|nr:het-domain-containing protein [Fusarium bulbicola]
MANNTLSVGETLTAGSFLISTNNRFKLLVQKDGNLVLYRLSTGFNGQEVMAAQWASHTWRETHPNATELIMQEDGDLVLFQSRPGREVAWSTQTGGRDSRDAYVMLNDNGDWGVYSSKQQGKMFFRADSAEVISTAGVLQQNSSPSPNLLAGIDVGKLIISGIVQGLSMVEGGGLITEIAGLIWPDLFDEASAAMRALEEGLKDFARDLIDQKSIETLRKKTRGLVDAYRQYDALSPGEDKAEWLNALLVWFTTNKEFYCDTDSPAKTLPYFVTMATMHLAVLRDRSYRYRDITKREWRQSIR